MAVGLLAKAALYKKDYATLAGYTSQIINNGGYTLAALNTWLTDPATTKTIWAPAFSNIDVTASWYYTLAAFPGITVQYFPVLRYGQILMMDVEAQVALGANGYRNGTSNLLPVPQAILNYNSGLNQNPGY